MRKPRLTRIFASDYLAMLSVMGLAVMWATYLVTSLGGALESPSSHTRLTGSDPVFLGFAVVASIILVPLAVFRVRSVQRVFADGVRTTGTVTGVQFYRDRGRVEYRFRFRNRQIEAGAPLHKTATTSQLRVGQEVDLVANPEKPTQAFVVDLYC